VSKIRLFIFLAVQINCLSVVGIQGLVSTKSKTGIGMYCSQTETMMDRATATLFFKDKMDWRGGLLQRPRMARRVTPTNERTESPTSLEEISAWVNEGGAGGEVRR
jgi:hypothetical protein